MSIESLKIHQVVRVLNEPLNISFEKLQIAKVIPIVPGKKDFNEDLKDIKSSEIKLKDGGRRGVQYS